MEMHCYPQADLFSLFADEGARLVYVREDDTPGRRDIFVSQVFVLMKWLPPRRESNFRSICCSGRKRGCGMQL